MKVLVLPERRPKKEPDLNLSRKVRIGSSLTKHNLLQQKNVK